MPAKKRVAVITYNGADGACAAAMVLLRHPDANVLVSSAASIEYTLGLLEQEKRDFSESGFYAGGKRRCPIFLRDSSIFF